MHLLRTPSHEILPKVGASSGAPGVTRIYGATSIPYAVILAVAHWCGVPPPIMGPIVGALFWGLTNIEVFALARARAPVWVAWGASMVSAFSLAAPELSLGMETGLVAWLSLLTLRLYGQRRDVEAFLAGAVLTLTRIDGLLVLFILAAHFLMTVQGSLRQRLRSFGRQVWLGVLVLGLCAAVLRGYFGTLIPHPLATKLSFDVAVSGQFDLTRYMRLTPFAQSSWSEAAWIGLLCLAALGAVRSLAHFARRSAVVDAWMLSYGVVFVVARAPDSPWYYAPVIPALAVSFAHGADAFVRLILRGTDWSEDSWNNAYRLTMSCVLATVLVACVVRTARFIAADPWGRGFAASDERRLLSGAIRADMRRKGLGTASIVAAEVGALGYFIPGEVHDILGLVSSDLLGSSSSERALFMMDRYDPDYVVITDENQYAPTGIVHQSRALQERYEPIHTVSRVFGD